MIDVERTNRDSSEGDGGGGGGRDGDLDASGIQGEEIGEAAQARRQQKKTAMNRMRMSIKDTLFKGVTRKVNPETADATEGTESGSNNHPDKSNSYSQQRISGKRTLTIGVTGRSNERIPGKLEGDFVKQNWNTPMVQHVERESGAVMEGTHIFEETYELTDAKLGQGCHGNVQKCKRKSDGMIFAVKMIRNGDTEIILSAITSFKIAQTLHHSSIIKPQELFINRETEKIFYVMEYCPYDSLEGIIQSTLWIGVSGQKKAQKQLESNGGAGGLEMPLLQMAENSIPKIKRILQELLSAVMYMHAEGICHRDLKPANILVSSDCTRVKIIDLDISKRFKFMRPNRAVIKASEMWTRTGTQDYMSPEMFESTGYTEAVDNWAVGVIAYQLLTGRLPFDQEYISDKIDFIREAKYNTEYLKNVDEVPKDFIRRMLKKDPKDRLSAFEALQHPWFLVESNENIMCLSAAGNSSSGYAGITIGVNGTGCNDATKLRSDYNLAKGGGLLGGTSNSNVMFFHSPQVSEKNPMLTHDDTAAQMLYYPKEMVLVKGNQSTILSGKDSKNPYYFDRNRDPKLGHRISEDYQIRVKEFDESEEDVEGRGSIDLMAGENVNAIDHVMAKVKRKQSNEIEAQRKEAFIQMVKQFKEEMTDLRLIHINQKKVQPNQVSQLRLRLLMEKSEKEAQNAAVAGTAAAITTFGKEQKEFCSSAELAPRKASDGLAAMMNTAGSSNVFMIMSESEDDGIIAARSRSNTENELVELREAFYANETRAKRLSEDFTSPCIGKQNPPSISMNLTAVNGIGNTFVVDANAFRKSTNLSSESETFFGTKRGGGKEEEV